MKVQDKNIVITGGASGIGKAMANSFSKHKANSIVVVDIDETALRETANNIDALPIIADVSNENEIFAVTGLSSDLEFIGLEDNEKELVADAEVVVEEDDLDFAMF